MPSTTILPFFRSTLSTRPRVPLSSPQITSTVSPLRMCMVLASPPDDFPRSVSLLVRSGRLETCPTKRQVRNLPHEERNGVESQHFLRSSTIQNPRVGGKRGAAEVFHASQRRTPGGGLELDSGTRSGHTHRRTD